jgi:hypothetical protein
LFELLTYGALTKKRSDIDIVVITNTLIRGSELNTIKNIHKEMGNIIKMVIERPYYDKIFYDEATYGNE